MGWTSVTGTALAKWVFALAALAAGYILFAGQLSAGEALAAVPAVGAGFMLAVLQRRHAKRVVPVTGASLRGAKTVPAALARDTVLVGWALLRALVGPVAGSFVAKDVEGAEADARAVAVLSESLAPNGYVIDYDESRMVLHRLAS